MQIERNYTKNPHTARWLMTFHTAGGTNLGGAVAEAPGTRESRCLECQGFHPGGASCAPDLLDLVPATAPTFTPSLPQRDLVTRLIGEIRELDATSANSSLAYTQGMTRNGAWTRENISDWIDRLIAKRDALRAAAAAKATTKVADGRYAVEENGELKFFKVKNGRKPGYVFLDIQASDDWHAIRNLGRIHSVIALIAADPKAAMARYGREIGACGRCGRTLTSEYRELGIGPVCIGR